MTGSCILWRRLDLPGHEAARLTLEGASARFAGCAVFAHEGRPCKLGYTILCDSRWQTVSGRIEGWIGDRMVDVVLAADGTRAWRLNGVECPAVAGCIDVDLNFSPSTNTLPIRRLNLAVGREAPVHAAWLRFPELTLEPLDQVYRRTGARTYRYSSDGGTFGAEIEVNDAGLVTTYPGLWEEQR